MRLAAALLTLPLLAQQRAPGNETISRDQLKADLYFLASDDMRGRLTGSPEYAMAAKWVQSRFERLGLAPVGGNLVHRFDLVLARLARGNRFEAGGRTGRLREDFYPLIFSPEARASAEVLFVGFGVSDPQLGWDDYKDRNVANAIVLMLEGDPGADDPKSPFDGVVNSEWGNSLRKAMAAQERGAAGVLIVNAGQAKKGLASFASAARTYWPDKPQHLERYTLATYADRIQIPVAQISPALAERIFGGSLADQAIKAESQAAATQWLRSSAPVTLQTAVERQIVEDRNVIAMIEGSDSRLKQEAVIVSAHYDHNGADGAQIYNGADDNGSGTVGLLEIAEAYSLAAAQGQRPKRTVIFAAWGSEERCCGPLLGAWEWVEHPAWPLDKTVAVLNMDMIGRSEEVLEGGGTRFNGLKLQTAASNANSVNIIGYSYSPDLSAAVDKANRMIDMRLLRRYDNNRSNLLRRSDQWPFLNRGVPAIWFHTGLHPDYHTVYDRPERIDYAKMEKVARLVHQLSWELANGDGRPRAVTRREIPQGEQ
ncbi:MAG: M28 family peptidase [Bryobacteraceae bacterium]